MSGFPQLTATGESSPHPSGEQVLGNWRTRQGVTQREEPVQHCKGGVSPPLRKIFKLPDCVPINNSDVRSGDVRPYNTIKT